MTEGDRSDQGKHSGMKKIQSPVDQLLVSPALASQKFENTHAEGHIAHAALDYSMWRRLD